MKYKWVVLTVTTVGVLMNGINSRIVIIGLPQVAAALHADAEQAIWFTQSYVLATVIALLLIGRVTDIVGRAKIYTMGFAVFTIGSALTSIAQNPNQFILQGNFDAPLDGAINQVSTFGCFAIPPNLDPAACNNTSTFSGTSITPVNVVAGQQVLVTVRISFS